MVECRVEPSDLNLSIIIPILREPDLARRLAPLLEQAGPDTEIIVVDGSADGDSLHGLSELRIQTLISPQTGRGQQLRTGADVAKGEILLFLHADTRLPKQALQQIGELLFRHPELAGGAFDLGIDAPQPIFRLIETVSSWRSRLTRLPYGDQALFLRKHVYQAIGGFPNLPLMEDVGIGQRLKRQGFKLGFLPLRVKTSARRWQAEGVLRCTLRNWLILGLYLAGVAPDKLSALYRRADKTSL